MKKERKQSIISQKCPFPTCRQVAGTVHYIEDKGLTHFWSNYRFIGLM